MPRPPFLSGIIVAATSLLGLAGCSGCSSIRDHALFHPGHHLRTNGLTPWILHGTTIGYARPVETPRTVWLLLHGNAGQAADRAYALPRFALTDAVYIVEYPGFGARAGSPSPTSCTAAAVEAYTELCRQFPDTPIAVVGESIGTGPASLLARQPRPPAKIVLIVPYAQLNKVAAEHMPWLPTGLVMGQTWDNAAALADYRGPIEIYAAEHDTVIPNHHAKALAAALPAAKFTLLPGGHNDWSQQPNLNLRNP